MKNIVGTDGDGSKSTGTNGEGLYIIGRDGILGKSYPRVASNATILYAGLFSTDKF
jgi:hypothetical protein